MKHFHKKYLSRITAGKIFGMMVLFVVLSLTGCSGSTGYAAEKSPFSAEQSVADSSDPSKEEEKDAQGNTSAESQDIYVYVCGQVTHSGVFQLPEGSRVFEALEMAGGLKKGADLSALNQAAKLEDGEKIYIPKKGEVTGSPEGGQTDAAGSAGASGKVNINTASQQELTALNGIGDTRAVNIINYRTANGRFQNIEDLKSVTGIGDGIYNQVKDRICVN